MLLYHLSGSNVSTTLIMNYPAYPSYLWEALVSEAEGVSSLSLSVSSSAASTLPKSCERSHVQMALDLNRKIAIAWRAIASVAFAFWSD